MAKFTGGCRCGAIRYTIQGSPRSATNCHCRDCQKSSGAPYMSWALFRRQSLSFDKGTPEIYTSQVASRGFCKICGNPIFWQDGKLPDWIDITITSLDQPDKINPKSESWVESKREWVHLTPNLKAYNRSVGS